MQLKKLCAICSAVLVAFSCSLVPAVISPAFADDDAVTSGNTCSGYLRADISNLDYGQTGINFWPTVANYGGVVPFSGNCNTFSNSKDSSYFVRFSGGSDYSTRFYPDYSLAVTLYTPVTVGLHMLCKIGMASSVSATGYSGYSTHAFYQVGGVGYNASNAIVTTIGNSSWATAPKKYDGSAFSDYSTGYCFRVDLPYPYGSNGFAINGIGLWVTDFMQSTTGTLAPLLGYCVVWRDSGDSAVDDAVTSLLTHVASLDGNVSAMLITLNGILGYCRDIGADTHTIVTLLNSIDTHLDTIDDNVASLYQLMTNKTCAVGYLSGSDGTAFPTYSIPYDVATAYCADLNANFVGESVPYFRRDDSTPLSTRILNSVTIDSGNRLKMSFIDSVSGQIYYGFMCDSAKRIFVVDPNTNYGDLINKQCNDIYTLLHDTLADESAQIDNKSKQVAESVMQQENSEQYWNDKNQENFDALDLNNFSFSSGVVSALGTVGNLFTSIWNSLGDTVVIFTFPLMLGITLVAIGRVSRHGGKGKSGKGGDSE